MANSYKDVIITPNRSSTTADPNISLRGGNTSVNTEIVLKVYPDANGTLSFEGSAGQLFSVTNDLTGSIFAVSDVSGIPSIEVFANGNVVLAQFSGNVGIGNATPAFKLDVAGDIRSNTRLVVGNSTVNVVINSSSVSTTGTVGFGNTVITGDLTVSGNVFFNGTTTNVNSTNLVVEDKNIILGDVATPTDITADGGGITLKGATDKTLNWVDATDAWTSSEEFNLLTGKSYRINGAVVVNSTSLGTGITGSSLTSVGTLTTLAAGNTTITGFANVIGTVRINNPASPTPGFEIVNNAVSVNILANAGAGSYNSLVAAGDNILYFSNNTQNNGNLVIGSWTSFTGGFGIKLVGNTYHTQIAGNTFAVSNGSANIAFFAANGNVGIANATPIYKLDVTGQIRATTSFLVGTAAGTQAGDDNLIRPTSTNSFLNIKGGSGRAKISLGNDGVVIASGTTDQISFHTNAAETTIGTERMQIAANGNVGIANATPASALSIKGNQLFISNTDTSTSIVIRNEGNNTTARYPQLAIYHYSGNTTGGSAGGQPVVELLAYAGNTSVQQAVVSGTILGGFNTWGSNSTAILSATRIQGIAEANFTSSATAGLQFITTDAGTQSEKVRIAANGNVGIGNTSPTEKLVVNGNILANNLRRFTATRTLSTTVNNTVEIGTLDTTHGAHNINIHIQVTDSGFSVAKRYEIISPFSATGSTTYRRVTPTYDTGPFSSNDFDLEAYHNGSIIGLRLRRTGGSTAGTAEIVIEDNILASEGISSDIFTPSTTTASAVAAVTDVFPGNRLTLTGVGHATANAFVVQANLTTSAITSNSTVTTFNLPITFNNYTIMGSTGQTTLSLTTSATTANQVVATAVGLGTATWRSVEYLVQVTSGTAYQLTKIGIVHDGTTVYKTEYATVLSGALLATFDADINSGTIRLLTTPVNAVTVYKGLATFVAI